MNNSCSARSAFFRFLTRFSFLVTVAFFACLALSATALAATPAYTIIDNPTGGSCTAIGSWDAATKTCTLSTDLSFTEDGIEIVGDGMTLDGNGHTLTGSHSKGSYELGVIVTGRSYVGIRNLTVRNFTVGIILAGGSYNTVRGNTVLDNYWYGIETWNGMTRSLFEGNNASGNGYGLCFAYLSNSMISGNIIAGNREYGIEMYGAGGNTITLNTMANNGWYGLGFMNSPDNRIYWNNFIANSYQVQQASETLEFNMPAPVGGNYWSDLTGPDANADGFVDVPYVVVGCCGDNRDYLPWTQKDGWLSGTNRPNLSLALPAPLWASYSDYLARELSVQMTVRNNGSQQAMNVQIIASSNNAGVSLITPLPLVIGNINGITDVPFTLKYRVPVDVSIWLTSITATAQDTAGSMYTYP